MTDPPRRYKTVEELSVEEHVQRMQALKAGKPEPSFETAGYQIAKRQALEAAGFESDDPPATDAPTDWESADVDAHLAQIRSDR